MPDLTFHQPASFSMPTPDDLQAEAGRSASPAAVLEADLYEGGMLVLPGVPVAVVIDLKGLDLTAKPRPMLFLDNPGQVIGHTESVEVVDGVLQVVAVLSGTGERAKEVQSSAANGFPWQVSFFVEATNLERVPLAKSVEVNGRHFDGPLMVYRESRLKYVSIQSTDMGEANAAKIHPRDLHPGVNATLHALALQAECDEADETDGGEDDDEDGGDEGDDGDADDDGQDGENEDDGDDEQEDDEADD